MCVIKQRCFVHSVQVYINLQSISDSLSGFCPGSKGRQTSGTERTGPRSSWFPGHCKVSLSWEAGVWVLEVPTRQSDIRPDRPIPTC